MAEHIPVTVGPRPDVHACMSNSTTLCIRTHCGLTALYRELRRVSEPVDCSMCLASLAKERAS
jgi:hypothetical protein